MPRKQSAPCVKVLRKQPLSDTIFCFCSAESTASWRGFLVYTSDFLCILKVAMHKEFASSVGSTSCFYFLTPICDADMRSMRAVTLVLLAAAAVAAADDALGVSLCATIVALYQLVLASIVMHACSC